MKKRKDSASALMGLIILLIISGFLLLFFRDEQFDPQALVVGAALIVMISLHYGLCHVVSKNMDRHILIIVYLLLSISMVLLYRLNSELAIKQLAWIGVGMIGMLITMLVMRYAEFLQKMIWPIMIISVGLLLAVLLFGKETGGAKNWLGTESIKIQPSEFVKIAVILVLATWLSRTHKFFGLWPLWAFLAACIVSLALSRDLGTVILYAIVALVMYFVATGNWLVTGAGIGAAALGSVAAYNLFSHVRVRFAVWRNPWASYGEVGGGYQIAQGLIAIASGGLFGLGLTRGMPKGVPVYESDYIFAVICEEMGMLVGVAVIALYLLLVLRIAAAAFDSEDSFHGLVAIGAATLFAMQSFLIIGGVIKLIPLTGVTLPFVSYGGSSMLSCFMLLGLVQSVVVNNDKKQRDR